MEGLPCELVDELLGGILRCNKSGDQGANRSASKSHKVKISSIPQKRTKCPKKRDAPNTATLENEINTHDSYFVYLRIYR